MEETIILPKLDKELAQRRNEQIVRLVKKGVKQIEIARMFRISRQRVHQILKREREEK